MLFNTMIRQQTASQQQQFAAQQRTAVEYCHSYRNTTLTALTVTSLIIIKLTDHQI